MSCQCYEARVFDDNTLSSQESQENDGNQMHSLEDQLPVKKSTRKYFICFFWWNFVSLSDIIINFISLSHNMGQPVPYYHPMYANATLELGQI